MSGTSQISGLDNSRCHISTGAGHFSFVKTPPHLEAEAEVARQQLAALFRVHHEAVARYVRRRTSPELVDDAVAETFLVACRRPTTVPADPLPWVLGGARG